MRWIIAIALAFVLSGGITGCAQLAKFQSQSADKVAKVITEYCANTDQDFRDGLRADVNAAAAPHTIVITCN